MWVFEGKEFTEEMIPEGAVGFVYEMMSIIDGKSVRYIGKKNFYADLKTKLAKKDMPTDKRLKTYKRKRVFTYKQYYSSNETLKNAYKEGVNIRREILHICYSKQQLSYYECKYQFALGVLESDEFLNGNILGKFYKIAQWVPLEKSL
jgi:hypothetical protein